MDNKQKFDDFTTNKIYLFRCIYMIRKNLPTNNIFYITMFILNYIGAIVCSRIPEMSINTNFFSLNKILSNFLIFGKNYKALQKNYEFYSILGALILLVYIIFCLFCFFYMKTKYKKVSSLKDYKMHSLGKNHKMENILFKVISYIFITIIFFRQYIFEYYFFAIYSLFLYASGEFRDDESTTNANKYDKNSYAQIYSYFSKYNFILCFIISIIVIVLIMTFFVFFMLWNSTKGLFLNYGYPFSDNKKYISMKIVLLSLQPFYGITVLFNDNTKIYIAIIFDGLLIIFCFFSFYSCFHQFGLYPSVVTNICLFMEFFILISSISQLIIYYTGLNFNSNSFILVRLCVEIIDTVFLMFFFIHINDKYNLNLFSANIFSTNFKCISKGGFYYYMKMYKKYEKDKNKNYTQMFKIILTHINNCNKIDCPGKKLISKSISESEYMPIVSKNDKKLSNENLIKMPDNYLNLSDSVKSMDEDENFDNDNEKEILNVDNLIKKHKKQNTVNSLNKENNIIEKDFYQYPSIINEKNKLSDKQFQMIFEQEIINHIDYLNKRKKYNYLEDYIFIHLQYLLQIRKNYSLTLYYAGKYRTSGIKWSFYTRYFLYEYKKYLISIYYSKTNQADIDETVNKYRKENQFLRRVIYYFNYCSILRLLIVKSCANLKILFSLRKDLHNNIVLKSYQRKKTKNVLESAKSLQKCINDIGIILKKHHIKYRIKLVSPELSYLLSNFYIFIMKKIPFDIKQYIEPKLDFDSVIDQLETGYKFFNLIHPFLLALTKNDTFSIVYLSNLVCAKLGYFKSELLNKDFHEKMFPGYKFIKEHELIMKQFLFCDCNSIQRSNAFLKTKDGYLVGVKVGLKKLPSFFDDFLYIVDIEFNDDFYNAEINKKYNRYSFLLDDEFDFMYMTRNFYEDFEFNVKMLKDIHTNFLEFFCIDQNTIYKKIKEFGKNNSILMKNTTNIMNFIKQSDSFTIFKNINYENVFEQRKIYNYENISFKPIIFHDKIDKNKIIKSLSFLSKLIEEYGLDCEWYKHIDNLRQRLLVKDIVEEEDSYDESMESSDRKKKIAKNSFIFNSSPEVNNKSNKRTSGSYINFNLDSNKNVKNKNANFINSNIVVNIDRCFEVMYTLKRICNVRYSIVDLCEKTDYINYENKNELMEDKNLDKNEMHKFYMQKSINYKKTIKNGRLTIKKNINPLSLSLIDDNDIYKNNKLYDNNDIKLSPTNKTKISRTKTNLNNEQNILMKKSFYNDNNKLIEKKSREQNEVEKNKKIQKKEIFYKKSLNTEENKKSNTENDNYNRNKDIQTKTANDLFRDKISNETPNIDHFNIYNMKIEKNIRSNIVNNININKENKKINETKNVSRNNESIEKSEKFSLNSFNMFNSITTNNNQRKQNNEDEEKISLINQDDFEDYIKKTHKKNLIYIIIIIVLFIILFILPTIKLIILTTTFSTNENIITLISSFEMIKMDLYSAAYILMGACAKMSNVDSMQVKIQFESQNKEIAKHITTLLNQFQEINNNKHIDNIILYIYSNIETYELNNDWSLKLRNNSNFIRELNYLEYIFRILSNQDDIYKQCNFENTYFQLFTKSSDEIYNEFGQPSETQKFLFYIMRNYMPSFKKKFSQVEDEMQKAQIKILDNHFQTVLIISICFCAVLFFGNTVSFLKSRLDIKFIVKIFLTFYHYEKKHLQLEYEVYYLEKVTKEFNIDNICLLENTKKYDGYYIFVKYLAKNEIKNHLDQNLNEIKKNENNKNRRSININENNKFNMDQKSMISFLLNQSASNNNSMIQFLNSKNNSSINNLNNNLNNNTNNNPNNLNLESNNNLFNIDNNPLINIDNQKISEDAKLFKENEESIFIIKKNNKMIPVAIIMFIWLPFIGSVLFILIMLYISLGSQTNGNTWKYSFYLSMNYLQRIPKIMELGIFLYFFAISGNLSLIEYENKKDHIEKMPIFMSYFTKLKDYDNSDLISSNFNDSYFTNILIDNLQIKRNIEYSLQDIKNKNRFTQYKIWNQRLNNEGYFCYNAAIGSIRLAAPYIKDISDFFKLVDDLAQSCQEGNEKIDETGLDLELKYIYQEFTYTFTDFCDNENKTEARKKFYEDSDMKRIINDMNLPFQYAFNVLTFFVREDMTNISKSIINDELLRIIINYVLSVCIVLFVASLMYLTEKDKKLLEFLVKILKRN